MAQLITETEAVRRDRAVADARECEMKLAEAAEALREAIRTIRAFHDMGMPVAARESTWAAYQHSPEMKRINAALAKVSK